MVYKRLPQENHESAQSVVSTLRPSLYSPLSSAIAPSVRRVRGAAATCARCGAECRFRM